MLEITPGGQGLVQKGIHANDHHLDQVQDLFPKTELKGSATLRFSMGNCSKYFFCVFMKGVFHTVDLLIFIVHWLSRSSPTVRSLPSIQQPSSSLAAPEEALTERLQKAIWAAKTADQQLRNQGLIGAKREVSPTREYNKLS